MGSYNINLGRSICIFTEYTKRFPSVSWKYLGNFENFDTCVQTIHVGPFLDKNISGSTVREGGEQL